jgi:hypothetical protein
MPRRVKWFGLPKKTVKRLNMQPWTPGSEQSAIFCFAYFANRKDQLDLEIGVVTNNWVLQLLLWMDSLVLKFW